MINIDQRSWLFEKIMWSKINCSNPNGINEELKDFEKKNYRQNMWNGKEKGNSVLKE